MIATITSRQRDAANQLARCGVLLDTIAARIKSVRKRFERMLDLANFSGARLLWYGELRPLQERLDRISRFERRLAAAAFAEVGS